MNLANIEASLSQGNFLSGKKLLVLYMSLCIMLLFPSLSIIIFIVMIVTTEWSIPIFTLFIGGDVLCLLFLIMFIHIKIKNDRLKEKIILWVEDAIQVRAFSKKIDENRLGLQPKATKIQIKFKINGEMYVKESTAKVFGGWQGYLGTFNKYANREINILYSPKYDEVLLLKN